MSNNEFDHIIKQQLLAEEYQYNEQDWNNYKRHEKKARFKKRVLFYFRNIASIVSIYFLLVAVALYINTKENKNNSEPIKVEETMNVTEAQEGVLAKQKEQLPKVGTLKAPSINEVNKEKNSTSNVNEYKHLNKTEQTVNAIQVHNENNQPEIIKSEEKLVVSGNKAVSVPFSEKGITDKQIETIPVETKEMNAPLQELTQENIVAGSTLADTSQKTLMDNNTRVAEKEVQGVENNLKPDSVARTDEKKVKRLLVPMARLFFIGSVDLNQRIDNTKAIAGINLGYSLGIGYTQKAYKNWAITGIFGYTKRFNDYIYLQKTYNRYFLSKETTTKQLSLESLLNSFNTRNGRHVFYVGVKFLYLIATKGQLAVSGTKIPQKKEEVNNYVNGIESYNWGINAGYDFTIIKNVQLGFMYYRGINEFTTSELTESQNNSFESLGIHLKLGIK
jgi:hypothetical protein